MSLELNKIAAAVLTAGVVAMGTGFVADLLVQPHPPEEPVYKVALKDDTGGDGSAAGGSGSDGSGDGGGAEEQGPSLATLLADASASSGEQASRVCAACHSFNDGGPHKVGPNLYNVVGKDIASAEGFNYSQALQDKEGKWTYEKLAGYLENPNGWAPGNNMSYQGIKDPQKLANVIAYLRQQADNPPSLPEPEQQTAEASGSGGESETDGGSEQQAAEGSGEMTSGEGDKASGDQAASGGDSGETQTAKADAAEPTGDGNGSGGSELEQKVASADPSAGKSAIGVCSACHSFNKGGPNKVGPNLYDVVGAKVASHEGFNYSDALSGVGGEWTIEKVDAYLENPNEFAPGNRMTYPGVKDDQKRYNIIAYMLQQSDKASGN